MEDAYLYLLVDRSHTRFKIGLTIDVLERADALERCWGNIDLEASYQIADDLLTITRLEKALHFIFRAWNTPRAQSGSGFSEWFDIACLADVLVEIQRIGDYQRSTRRLQKGIPPRAARRTGTSQKSSRLAEMLFPEYRFRVLRLFYQDPTEAHHVREVARLTNTVPGTVNRELKALHQAGLLRSERVGNQIAYAANPESTVYEEMQKLIEKV